MGINNTKFKTYSPIGNLSMNHNIDSHITNIPEDILDYIMSFIFNKKISHLLTTDYIKCRNIQLTYLYLVFKDDTVSSLLKDLLDIFKLIKKYPQYQHDYDYHIHYQINHDKTKNDVSGINTKHRFGVSNGSEYSISPNLSFVYYRDKSSKCGIISKSEFQLMFNNYYLIEQEKRNSKTPENSNPILIDILFSGCYLPCAYSTHLKFEDYMDNDIRKIIKLFPDCLHSDFGQLRCRTYVTPIAAACFNENVPLITIKSLIKEAMKLGNKNSFYNLPRLKIKVNGEWVPILEDLRENESHGQSHRCHNIEKIFNKYP